MRPQPDVVQEGGDVTLTINASSPHCPISFVDASLDWLGSDPPRNIFGGGSGVSPAEVGGFYLVSKSHTFSKWNPAGEYRFSSLRVTNTGRLHTDAPDVTIFVNNSFVARVPVVLNYSLHVTSPLNLTTGSTAGLSVGCPSCLLDHLDAANPSASPSNVSANVSANVSESLAPSVEPSPQTSPAPDSNVDVDVNSRDDSSAYAVQLYLHVDSNCPISYFSGRFEMPDGQAILLDDSYAFAETALGTYEIRLTYYVADSALPSRRQLAAAASAASAASARRGLSSTLCFGARDIGVENAGWLASAKISVEACVVDDRKGNRERVSHWFEVAFQASGDVSDYDGVDFRAKILQVLTSAAGLGSSVPADAELTITPASVNIVAAIPVASEAVAQGAVISFAAAITSAQDLTTRMQAAGVSMVVETTPTATATVRTSPGSSSSSSVGAIIGGAIGGIVFCGGALFCLWRWKRGSQRSKVPIVAGSA